MKTVTIIGAGAAGFFAAIRIAELRPDVSVTIYEKSPNILGKVKVSGGGRCNVTHHCFEPRELVKHYPRGQKSLIGPFTQFGPSDTINWFESRGVELKTEPDGRMFPVSNNSETIIDCLLQSAKNTGVKIQTARSVEDLQPVENGKQGWNLKLSNGENIHSDVVMMATGSSERALKIIRDLGIETESSVPSLFTFNCVDKRLQEMSGISFPEVKIKILNSKLNSSGPLLITHWGLSGPAVLKISAWGARELHKLNYQFRIQLNFFPDENAESMFLILNENRFIHSKKKVFASSPFEQIPKRYWQKLIEFCKISETQNWADLSNPQLRAMANELTAGIYDIRGKSTFKEEFVTCGGVSLSEIDLKTMASKMYSGLYFGGEVMNVDAVTGGFNFQHAWTSGYIAASAIAEAAIR